MQNRKIILILIILILTLSLSGCVPNDGTYTVGNPAGFWWGIWHGMIWFYTFILGVLTNGKYTIYEAINTGWGYNLGFLIGTGVLFGDITIYIKKRKERSKFNDKRTVFSKKY